MSINGAWKMKMSSPLGPQEGDLVLSTVDGVLSGYMEQSGNKSEIEEGTIDTNGSMSWKTTVTKPLKLSAAFTAVYDGADTISGKAKLGFMGGAKFEAVRA